MEDIINEYELSLYSEIKTILDEKVYIVNHSINNQFFVKKCLSLDNLDVYKALKGVKNKNVALVVDYFKTKNRLIVIEEFINGKNLEQILEDKVFSSIKAVGIILEICDGLQDLHNMKKQIVHRDLKPSNIMITSDGTSKIIDFDAARLSDKLKDRDTTLIGTKGYASPEQFGFAQTDNRSDIYSIGVLLNYMILKKYPNEEVVSGFLGDIIKKATEVDRKARYQNVEELSKDLNKFLASSKSKPRKKIKNFELKKFIKKVDIRKKVRKQKNKDIENINIKNKDIKTTVDENFSKNFKAYKKEKKQKKFIKNLIGFRSNKLFNKILASIWYTMFIIVVLGTSFAPSRVMIVTALYILLLPILIFGNGFGMNKFIPFINSKNIVTKIFFRIVYAMVLTVGISFLAV